MNSKTVQGHAEARYEIQRSRFLSFVRRADSEAEALRFLGEIRKTHWEARHHCSAYRIGVRGMCQRADDDGEPSGTAGKPILEIIKKQELYDVIIIVTRYFGGIKLGAGGLIRAYAKAASLGIAAAVIVERILHQRFAIEFAYPLLGALENHLQRKQYRIESKEFTDSVRFVILVTAEREALLRRDIADWTAMQAQITKLDPRWLELPLISESRVARVDP